MSVTLHLLGSPHVQEGGAYQVRSRKSWALLAYLVLNDRPVARSRLADLLYGEADDPLRALRWGLAEIRKCLGMVVDGDPVALRLPAGTLVDVDVLSRGAWADALELPGLGAELLDGIAVRCSPAYEGWLLSERRRLAAAAEAVLHEAALGKLAAGDLAGAREPALRAAAMSPLDENHQALLIRLYRLAGEDRAAERQYTAFARLLHEETGATPGIAVESARRERRRHRDAEVDTAAVEAIVESGAAAVAAGAAEAGVQSLRTAVRLADRVDVPELRRHARLRLGEALIHSLRGMDEEGLAVLYEADRLAEEAGDAVTLARARAEIGYVDFLRARYDRAERWLTGALAVADGSPGVAARVTTYLGAVHSDRGDYPRAVRLLEQAARDSAGPRTEAYARSMLGRAHLLAGRLDKAAAELDLSTAIAERDHWLAFLPWPQAWRGEVHLAAGERAAATGVLTQAFARACRLGDPCWEGMAARSLALVAEAEGDPERAFGLLADARARSNRLADPYVWLDAYIVDTQSRLGRRYDHPETAVWAEDLQLLLAKTGIALRSSG